MEEVGGNPRPDPAASSSSSAMPPKHVEAKRHLTVLFIDYVAACNSNEEERAKGGRVEVGRAHYESITTRFTILHLRGHESNVANMKSLASQADICVLVTSALKGEYETGDEKGQQTREHLHLARNVGLSKLIVVVSDMGDPTVCWEKARYVEIESKMILFLRSSGYNVEKDVLFLPFSGPIDANMNERMDENRCPWWDGPCLFEVLDTVEISSRDPSGANNLTTGGHFTVVHSRSGQEVVGLVLDLDRITKMRSDITGIILSLMPIKDAVRTCVLSKAWRNKWYTLRDVIIDVNMQPYSYRDTTDVSMHALDTILKCVSRPKKLVLDIVRRGKENCPVDLPLTVFSFKHMVELTILEFLLRPPSAFGGFERLKRLSLLYVTMDQESCDIIISRSNDLESLTIVDCTGFSNVTISKPKLKDFCFRGDFEDLVFKKASLYSVEIDSTRDVIINERAVLSWSRLLSFFGDFCHVKYLGIKGFSMKYLAANVNPRRIPRLGKAFIDLYYLFMEMDFDRLKESYAAFFLLIHASNIFELKLLHMETEERLVQFEQHLDRPWKKTMWKNIFKHLEIVAIAGLSGTRTTSQFEIIEFLLSNAPILKFIIISDIDMSPQIEEKISSFGLASPDVEFIYE